MINRQLIELIFEAASMQRWNDHIRPRGGFTELDKQAHKIFLAWVLGKFEEQRTEIDWTKIITGGFFEFIQRVILTDIKRPIFYKLIENPDDARKLNEWVVSSARKRLGGFPADFFCQLNDYLTSEDTNSIERKILNAAHYLATNWEFQIIYHLNPSTMGVERTKAQIESEIEDHYELIGVQKIALGRKTADFVNLVGQLRFQQRWAQSPRVPETSVMGHMLVVALLSYLSVAEMHPCGKRQYNAFFGGLFHDLPEVLTRDIISPVKSSVEGLDDLIKQIETRQIEEEILPLLPKAWHDEVFYFIEDEFASKIRLPNGLIQTVSAPTLNAEYNQDEYSPLDGEIIKICDKLAAYVEASLSLIHGVSSQHLIQAKEHLLETYQDTRLCGMDFGALFKQFTV